MLLPLLASKTFSHGGETYGLLMGTMGAGAVIGSLIVAASANPTERRVSGFSLLLGASLVAVAAAPTLTAAFLAAAVMGACFSLFVASCSAFLQLNARSEMRGRIMAFYTIVFLGTAPVGGPLVGAIAQLFGVRVGLLVGAFGAAAAGVIGLLLGRRYRRYKSLAVSRELGERWRD